MENTNLLKVFELNPQESSKGLLSGVSPSVETFFCFGVSRCSNDAEILFKAFLCFIA